MEYSGNIFSESRLVSLGAASEEVSSVAVEVNPVAEVLQIPLVGHNARADVLYHSIAVFTSKGVAATTVQDLLDAAKISRRTFYKYFKSKLEVLESLYEISTSLLLSRFEAEMASSSNMNEFVRHCVSEYFDYHVQLGPLVRMLNEEAMGFESPLAQHRNRVLQGLVQMFNDKYYELEGTRVDPQIYYALIWAMECAANKLLTGAESTEEEVARVKRCMSAFAGCVVVSDQSQRPRLPTVLEPASIVC